MGKLEKLENLLRTLGSGAVAFSGGVDSTFLLAVAHKVLGDKTLAVIGRSPTYPSREMDAAVELAQKIGVHYEVVDTCELDNSNFRQNPPDRCYHCKQTLFGIVGERARAAGFDHVLEGSNADDTGDYRPGMRAIEELGVRSPLLEVGLTKMEIRELSRDLDLPTWNKPAMACLSSRIPYGEEITVDRLSRIEKAEAALKEMGLGQLRVRDHGAVARVEVEPDRIAELAQDHQRVPVVEALKAAGYQYVTLDLVGYRMGSLNESLSLDDTKK